jgi:hypothetical protein
VVWMQKAVTPAMSHAYLTTGYDRLAGFMVRAQDVAFAANPEDIFDTHALGYPRSPFSRRAQWVDVLRIIAEPQLVFEDVSAVDDPRLQPMGVSSDGTAPVWWLRHSRITPDAELVRCFPDGTSALLAKYIDIGWGWQVFMPGVRRTSSTSLSRCVGPVARWHGGYLDADLIDDGRAVVLALSSPPLSEPGFEATPAGRWRRVVDRDEVSDLFELDLTGRYGGLAVRMVDQWKDAVGSVAIRVSSIAPDAELAERLGMQKAEAGVYEATVPAALLTDSQTLQIQPASWRSGATHRV